MDVAEKIKQRVHTVPTAGGWFRAAREAQDKGDMGTALLCMENAYNHTENALAALLKACRGLPRETPKEGAASTLHDFKIPAYAVWDLDRVLTVLGEQKSRG
jgi:hypothetical protein